MYGSKDINPIFDSGELPGAPFFLQFSPDEESIAVLTMSSGKGDGDAGMYANLYVKLAVVNCFVTDFLRYVCIK